MNYKKALKKLGITNVTVASYSPRSSGEKEKQSNWKEYSKTFCQKLNDGHYFEGNIRIDHFWDLGERVDYPTKTITTSKLPISFEERLELLEEYSKKFKKVWIKTASNGGRARIFYYVD